MFYHSATVEIISFFFFFPQFLHNLCGTISALHLLHLTKVGAVIFQFALRLSLLAFEDLFLGQILMPITPPHKYSNTCTIIQAKPQYVNIFFHFFDIIFSENKIPPPGGILFSNYFIWRTFE